MNKDVICGNGIGKIAWMFQELKSLLYFSPTADSRETWQSTMRHIACEGRCFVLGCNQFVKKEMYGQELETIQELSDEPDIFKLIVNKEAQTSVSFPSNITK